MHQIDKPRIFITGGTGYIGGSFLHLMLSRDYLHRYDIAVLVRRSRDAELLSAMGVTPVVGTLDDDHLLNSQAAQADIVFNTANCDHRDSTAAIVSGLALRKSQTGNCSILIHTSGAGVLSDTSNGMGVALAHDTKAVIWDDADAEAHAKIPYHAPHREVDLEVFAASRKGTAKTYLVVPPTVFGVGLGPFAEQRMSIQIPRLIYQSLLIRRAAHVGTGENVWANVHVADLAELYLLILDAALAGRAPEGAAGLFYPVTEHFTWLDVAKRIGQELYEQELIASAEPVTGLPQGWFWGSNVRLRSSNGSALGWQPKSGGTETMLKSIPQDLALVLNMARQARSA